MSVPAERRAISRAGGILTAVAVLVVGLMAYDHLVGNEPDSDDAFPVDPVTFVVSIALTAACLLLVFALLVPRAVRPGAVTPRWALGLSLVSLVTVLPGGWLGFPLAFAAGGIDLGLTTWRTGRGRIAVGVGCVAVALGILATLFPGSSGD